MIFCLDCGHALTGYHTGRRRYRHILRGKKHCGTFFSINAALIEQTVFDRLFSVLGDQAGLEKAMLRAIPDSSKITELRERKACLEAELKKTETAKNRVVRSISEGIISDAEAGATLDDLRQREATLNAEIDEINPQLVDVPTQQKIASNARLINRTLSEYYDSPMRFAKMTYDEKRTLLQSFFSGKDSQGNRLGVYLSKRNGDFRYEIRGLCGEPITATVDPEAEPLSGESNFPCYSEKRHWALRSDMRLAC